MKRYVKKIGFFFVYNKQHFFVFGLTEFAGEVFLKFRISRRRAWKLSLMFISFFAEASKKGHLNEVAESPPSSFETSLSVSKSHLFLLFYLDKISPKYFFFITQQEYKGHDLDL